jgi:hypothetical protein
VQNITDDKDHSMTESPEPKPSTSKGKRRLAIAVFLSFAVLVVYLRYVLFNEGILYGEAASKMASLFVAGVIVFMGYLPLRVLRGRGSAEEVPKESIAATLAAILGLAVSGYSVSELLAPNTPVAATVSACGGTPVYGAKFFAKTQANGVNARSGPGVEYPQVNRYAGDCTLGFDGYCIGRAVPDFILGTPDQRWLIVHDRKELIAAGVVLSESAESALGSKPSPECQQLGGLPQPSEIQDFSYNITTGQISASAPGAVAVGYGMATVPQRNRAYQVVALATNSDFSAQLSARTIANELPVAGGVWLSAAICLADNVPVVASLRVQLLTFDGSHAATELPDARVPSSVRPLLAEVACNSSGL